MRSGWTYFEQVPIEEAETVLRRAAVLAEEPQKTLVPFRAPSRQAAEEFLSQQKGNPHQGQP